jgi:hypothetical protein
MKKACRAVKKVTNTWQGQIQNPLPSIQATLYAAVRQETPAMSTSKKADR